MATPPKIQGLHHLALRVRNLEACIQFYTQIVGMKIEWQPDRDNVYLTSGTDNLALHRTDRSFVTKTEQRLDHIGFILNTTDAVETWYQYLCTNNIPILAPPKTHRDGARSFYCQDPDGNTIQFIYHPPLAECA